MAPQLFSDDDIFLMNTDNDGYISVHTYVCTKIINQTSCFQASSGNTVPTVPLYHM